MAIIRIFRADISHWKGTAIPWIIPGAQGSSCCWKLDTKIQSNCQENWKRILFFICALEQHLKKLGLRMHANTPTSSLLHSFCICHSYSRAFCSKLWPSNPTPGDTHWDNQNWKRHVYPNVHWSTIYNSQNMKATWMSISRWMDKDVVVHI